MSEDVCAGCGTTHRYHWACLACVRRLPTELSRALFVAKQDQKRIVPRASMSLSEARTACVQWWADNPDTSESPPPAWKRKP